MLDKLPSARPRPLARHQNQYPRHLAPSTTWIVATSTSHHSGLVLQLYRFIHPDWCELDAVHPQKYFLSETHISALPAPLNLEVLFSQHPDLTTCTADAWADREEELSIRDKVAVKHQMERISELSGRLVPTSGLLTRQLLCLLCCSGRVQGHTPLQLTTSTLKTP